MDKVVTVIGAGSWGLWTAIALLKKGWQVTLVEKDSPGNEKAGSGGHSRIIRLAYGSDAIYTRLTYESFALWERLFEECSEKLYEELGILWLQSGSDDFYLNASKIEVEKTGEQFLSLNLQETAKKYPGIEFTGIKKIFFEPRAGLIYASRACKVALEYFIRHGGVYKTGRVSIDQSLSEGTVLVNELPLKADKVVFAAGSWTRDIFPDELSKFTYVSRQEVFFYSLPEELASLKKIPLWFDYDDEGMFYYGFPPHEDAGFKVAYDDRSVSMEVESDKRDFTSSIESRGRMYLSKRFPGFEQAGLLSHKVCHYDNSIDGHFIIDRLPNQEQVLVMAGSSGHGFKLGPGLGQLVAEIISDEKTIPPLFTLERFEKVDNLRTQFKPHA